MGIVPDPPMGFVPGPRRPPTQDPLDEVPVAAGDRLLGEAVPCQVDPVEVQVVGPRLAAQLDRDSRCVCLLPGSEYDIRRPDGPDGTEGPLDGALAQAQLSG